MASITTSDASPGGYATGTYHRGSFAIMTSLFFLWGFMTVFNDILIPRFKEAFTLDFYHAMFVQLAFFGAYFIGSLVYFIVSATTGDPIAKMGYKNGVVIGLLISATGSALFWPAATLLSYPLFLGGLFIVGLGFAMLQIAANPYVTILGPERTASSRLNLAQAFNSVGTTIGPLDWRVSDLSIFRQNRGARSRLGQGSLSSILYHLPAARGRFLPDPSAARR